MSLDLTYVLPITWSDELDREEIAAYLRRVSQWVDEVIVVDGSDHDAFADNGAAWGSFVKHLAPDSDLSFANGKVDGVITGVRAAGHDKVVIADDDVRYEQRGLERVTTLLYDFDLVRPQNYFASPMPWHGWLDTSRMLLNRSLGRDYPGTLGFKRSMLLAAGGYDGDTMFENLELIRTIRALEGREAAPLDLFVERQPPTTDRFLAQRVRQAYDEFALPERMVLWLSVVPFVGWALARRRVRAVGGAAITTVALAELGRRRGSGTRVFRPAAPLAAPLWVLERGISMWLALGARLTGGARYRDRRIPVAAHSRRWHRRRAGRERNGSR
jgi:hypothetical protein